jgi:hypothetical protein
LMSYGPVAFHIWRCVAGYVDKIQNRRPHQGCLTSMSRS